jgi:protein-S-isoprenylcysteine O-methyltransferase Ste14
LSLTVWARRHLGKYWSATITLKQGHRVIQTGPYAWVRHPIYSGLILALSGTAIYIGTLQSFLGLGFLVASFMRKLSLEERWLREHLGDEYGRYQHRVKAVVPGLL